jgi:hypothetical protein
LLILIPVGSPGPLPSFGLTKIFPFSSLNRSNHRSVSRCHRLCQSSLRHWRTAKNRYFTPVPDRSAKKAAPSARKLDTRLYACAFNLRFKHWTH